MATQKQRFLAISITLFALLLMAFIWQLAVFLSTEQTSAQDNSTPEVQESTVEPPTEHAVP